MFQLDKGISVRIRNVSIDKVVVVHRSNISLWSNFAVCQGLRTSRNDTAKPSLGYQVCLIPFGQLVLVGSLAEGCDGLDLYIDGGDLYRAS